MSVIEVEELIEMESNERIAFIARGHVDRAEFCAEVKRDFETEIDEQDVRHVLARYVPWRDGGFWVQITIKPGRGAFKATYVDL